MKTPTVDLAEAKRKGILVMMIYIAVMVFTFPLTVTLLIFGYDSLKNDEARIVR